MSPNFRYFSGPVLIFTPHHIKPLVATPVAVLGVIVVVVVVAVVVVVVVVVVGLCF